MMITGQIQCPMCGEMVESLSFWICINKKWYIHLCDYCIKKHKTAKQLLMIGWHYGTEDMKEKMKEFLGKN